MTQVHLRTTLIWYWQLTSLSIYRIRKREFDQLVHQQNLVALCLYTCLQFRIGWLDGNIRNFTIQTRRIFIDPQGILCGNSLKLKVLKLYETLIYRIFRPNSQRSGQFIRHIWLYSGSLCSEAGRQLSGNCIGKCGQRRVGGCCSRLSVVNNLNTPLAYLCISISWSGRYWDRTSDPHNVNPCLCGSTRI